jgi:ATP/ADP translocase
MEILMARRMTAHRPLGLSRISHHREAVTIINHVSAREAEPVGSIGALGGIAGFLYGVYRVIVDVPWTDHVEHWSFVKWFFVAPFEVIATTVFISASGVVAGRILGALVVLARSVLGAMFRR